MADATISLAILGVFLAIGLIMALQPTITVWLWGKLNRRMVVRKVDGRDTIVSNWWYTPYLGGTQEQALDKIHRAETDPASVRDILLEHRRVGFILSISSAALMIVLVAF